MYHIQCPSHSSWQSLRSCEIFLKIASCYCEKLLAPHPNPNLKDHPLLAIRDGSLNTFTATLLIWWPFFHLKPTDASFCGDRDPLIIVKFLLSHQKLFSSGAHITLFHRGSNCHCPQTGTIEWFEISIPFSISTLLKSYSLLECGYWK